MQRNQSRKRKHFRNRPHKNFGRRDADLIYSTEDSYDLIGVARHSPELECYSDCDYKLTVNSLLETIVDVESDIQVLTADIKSTDDLVFLLNKFQNNVEKKTFQRAQRFECPKHSDKTSKSEHAANCKLNISCTSDDESNEVHGSCQFRMISSSPPIVVYSKWENIRDLLSAANIQNYTGKIWADYIRFRADCRKTYNQMLNVFDKNKVKYYTFTPGDQKRFRVVIRGVPSLIPVDLVKQYLVQQKYPVHEVSRMHVNKNKHPIDLVLVTLKNTDRGRSIYDLNNLFGHNIIIERPHISAGHRQCHRCQQYGHSQRTCRMSPRCVKCAGDHMTKKCLKRKDDVPRCANCHGEHTANFKGCPKAPLAVILGVLDLLEG